jgi:four helix bundle protein
MLDVVRRIKAWEHGHRLVVEVYRVTRRFPKEELYGLTSQLRRAAVSVPANIAEGSQRYFLKEYRKFLYTAKASLTEVEYYLYLAEELGYLQNEDAKRISAISDEAAKTLQGLIKWLEKQIRAGKLTKDDLKR